MYVLIASIQFYIEGIRHLGDLTLSCFVFSPWPDLQAYQAGAKLNPPSDIGLFVSVAMHNLRDERSAITNRDWDTLLKEACPLLKLKSKSKASKPYFDLAQRCLKRATQLQSETVKHDEFVASAAKPGILKLKQFFASAPQSVPGASTPAPATTPPQSPTISPDLGTPAIDETGMIVLDFENEIVDSALDLMSLLATSPTSEIEEPSADGCTTSTVNETYNALHIEMPDLEPLPFTTEAFSFPPSMFACNNEEPASGVACSEHQQRSDTEQPTTTSKKRERFVCRTLTAILLIYSAFVDSHKTSCNNSSITCQSIIHAYTPIPTDCLAFHKLPPAVPASSEQERAI